MVDRRIIVFAKTPRHGRVKTRLQPILTPASSVRLHRQLLLKTLLTSTSVPSSPTQLWCSPDKHSRYCQHISRRLAIPLHVQQGRGLGQRMRHALNSRSSGQQRMTVLIGSDCPGISADYLQRAFAALAHNAVVFGPASDGGYVLLGTRMQLPARCFDRIDWGKETVLEQSLDRMKGVCIRSALLPTLQDIDRPEDLASLDGAGLHRMRWLFGIE